MLLAGAVNAMHDSFTGLVMISMLNIELGEVVFGGVGAGLYGMLVFVVIAVFIAGLMVAARRNTWAKKLAAHEVKVVLLAFMLVLALSDLGFTAWACISQWGQAGLSRTPHGLSEILYAFSSCNGNNGSAFAGLTANTPWYNTTLAHLH